MNTLKTLLFWASRIIFGLTFLFSGFVKLIDPLGTVYKIIDYLTAMNLEIFSPLAYVIAWVLFSAEFLCGVLILLGIRQREGVLLGALFMIFMTPLTLWIAIADPVTDCGCFGDAFVLSNWETFWKNIVLGAMVTTLWMMRTKYKTYLNDKAAWAIAITLFVVPCIYSTCSLNYLPPMDFRPYNIGADIDEKMQFPEDAVLDRYETIFIYEKDGIQQEYSFTSLPDSTWTFVDQHTTLIEKGYTPPIHDFSITTLEGDDITYEILDDTARTYLCVMYDLNLTDKKITPKINAVYQKAQNEGARFIALTSSDDMTIIDFISTTDAQYPFALTDPIQLKTMVRANPGIVVIQNGIVIDKWNVQTQKLETKN